MVVPLHAVYLSARLHVRTTLSLSLYTFKHTQFHINSEWLQDQLLPGKTLSLNRDDEQRGRLLLIIELYIYTTSTKLTSL